MRLSTACLLLLASAFGGATALDMVDPSALVQELASHDEGLDRRWKRPEFCGKMDCPPFKTESHSDNFDLRKYDSGKWLVTNTTGSKFEVAYTKAVSTLLKYFKGSNDKEETIDATTPTLCEVKLDKEGKSVGDDFSFSLWIPDKYAEDPPQPTDADVKVVEYPSISVYVRTFGGFATEGTILDQAHSLQDMLHDEEQDFEDGVVWAAVYDPVQKLLHRHNEVHIPAAAKKS